MPQPQGKGQPQQNRSGDGIALLVIVALIVGGVWWYAHKNNVSSTEQAGEAVSQSKIKFKDCRAAGGSVVDCLRGAADTRPEPVDPAVAPPDSALAQLQQVKISEPDGSPYNRKDYKHWVMVGGECNTREEALRTQGRNVETDDKCRSVRGEWTDWYTGDVITDPKTTDLDHVIPLGYVNAHGGAAWDRQRKQDYANDLEGLLIVSAKENRSKSDKGPSGYMPKNPSFLCEYASGWVRMATKYGISVTQADYDVLRDTLSRCVPPVGVPAPVSAPAV